MKHKSIRKLKVKEVDEKNLSTIIQCGQMSPASNNLHTYTVIEVKNMNKKKNFLKSLEVRSR